MRLNVTARIMPVIFLLIAVSCSKNNGQGSSPIMPLHGTTANASNMLHSHTNLWGYYDVFIDIENQKVSSTLNRQVMFTANVVNFLNSNPAGLKFKINATPTGPDYIDVDIDVTITHPFPGLPQYHGYDVRGVFMGDGSASLNYNSDLIYPVLGTDQYMLDDPADGIGGPDGYTRWFNKSEFSQGGMQIFSYTQGKYASKGFNGTATLCPYKYFADDLGKNDDLWTWLNANPEKHGRFSSGASNTRNYYLRFPNTKGVVYGYAVTANWEGTGPQHHPSNAPEAVGCKVVNNSNVYYIDPSNKGGNLKLDISLFGWDYQPSAIFIESTVLLSPHELTPSEMIPIDGNENYSTYRTEIPADNITGTQNQEFWVIAQYNEFDYTNEFGTPNLAGADKLTAIFRYGLTVGNQSNNTPPVINGITDDIPPAGLNTSVSNLNTSVTYIAQFDDPDPGQTHTVKWYIEDSTASAPSEPNDSMPYNWAPKTPGQYKIWVKVSDGFAEVTGGPWTITRKPDETRWARTWGGASEDVAYSSFVDASGNIYTTGYYSQTVDFDPGPGVEARTSNGNDDIFLCKFDSSGKFLWVRTWGGTAGMDRGYDVISDSSGNVYVTGHFCLTVDFDPGPGVDNRTVIGGADVFLCKYDSSGNYLWTRTWGGTHADYGHAVVVDSSNDVYVTGFFEYTVDFDPGSGQDNRTSKGIADAFLSKFSSSGNYYWAKDWGGNGSDQGWGLSLDSSGNVYVAGSFSGGTVDFDPGPEVDNKTTVGSYDAFLSKFASSGAYVWAQTWGGNSFDYAFDVAVDNSNNILVCGYFMNVADLDPGAGVDLHTSKGQFDVFLIKFAPPGSYIWAKSWGGTLRDIGLDVAIDYYDNVYITGYYEGNADFDPGTGEYYQNSNGLSDVFLSKLNSSGAFCWSKSWGGPEDDFARGLGLDGSQCIYVSGAFRGNVDFDPGTGEDPKASNGGYDVFLCKLLPE